MLGRACRNYFAQAFSNLWRNKIMSFMATATVIFCLLLLGIALVLGFNINYISEQLEGQYEIHAYVDLSYTENQAKGLKKQIERIEYVKSADFVSKEEALLDMETNMEESASAFAMLHGEENPLPHTFDITLTDVRKANQVVSEISKISGIEEVKNRSDILNNIINTTRGAQLFGLIGMLIFALVGIFIISNTIKMSVMARSREIEIMKYVGATDWYIRWPFIIEGTIMGLIGAIITYIPIYFCYRSLASWWANNMPLFDLLSVNDINLYIIGVFLVMGCFLGAIGSIISIRKHLRV